jgi:hypothetical protein
MSVGHTAGIASPVMCASMFGSGESRRRKQEPDFPYSSGKKRVNTETMAIGYQLFARFAPFNVPPFFSTDEKNQKEDSPKTDDSQNAVSHVWLALPLCMLPKQTRAIEQLQCCRHCPPTLVHRRKKVAQNRQ